MGFSSNRLKRLTAIFSRAKEDVIATPLLIFIDSYTSNGKA
jgi:hypothetical protein